MLAVLHHHHYTITIIAISMITITSIFIIKGFHHHHAAWVVHLCPVCAEPMQSDHDAESMCKKKCQLSCPSMKHGPGSFWHRLV